MLKNKITPIEIVWDTPTRGGVMFTEAPVNMFTFTVEDKNGEYHVARRGKSIKFNGTYRTEIQKY